MVSKAAGKLAIACVVAGLLAGCGTYVPDGSTVIAVKGSKSEFDRAELRPPDNDLARAAVIRMKWYDTNTFITSGTLSPGVYSFRARNFSGHGFVQNVQITEDKHLYELEAETKTSDAAVQAGGPLVTGKITFQDRRPLPRSVAVLFIGKQIVMKTANLDSAGTFSVESPGKGSWKIEVHALGDKPVSYGLDVKTIESPMNLGSVTLR